jgi:hypothetical protein
VIQLFKQNSGHAPQRKLSINTSPIAQNNIISKAETPKAITLASPKAVAFKAKLQTIPELQVERNCEQVIKEHTQESSNVCRKIQDNLKNQSESLSQRLMFRKQATTPRYGKSCFVFEEHSQSDISAGEAKSNPVEEFENELEAIMEKYVEEKTKIKTLIREKYQEYFDETKTIKGEVREKLIQELTKNMNIEIFESLADIDKQRNDEIATARKKLHQKPLF